MEVNKCHYECYATIVSARSDKQQTGGKSISRAIAGGILFGGAGAIVGAASARSKTKTNTSVNRIGYGKLSIYGDKMVFKLDDGLAIIPIEYVAKIDTRFFDSDNNTYIRPYLDNRLIRNESNEKLHNSLQIFHDSNSCFEINSIDRKEIRKTLRSIKKDAKLSRSNMIKTMKSDGIKFLARRREADKDRLIYAWTQMLII